MQNSFSFYPKTTLLTYVLVNYLGRLKMETFPTT